MSSLNSLIFGVRSSNSSAKEGNLIDECFVGKRTLVIMRILTAIAASHAPITPGECFTYENGRTYLGNSVEITQPSCAVQDRNKYLNIGKYSSFVIGAEQQYKYVL